MSGGIGELPKGKANVDMKVKGGLDVKVKSPKVKAPSVKMKSPSVDMKVKGGAGMKGGLNVSGGAKVKVKSPSTEVKVKSPSVDVGCCGGKSRAGKADMKMSGGIGEIKGGAKVKGGLDVKAKSPSMDVKVKSPSVKVKSPSMDVKVKGGAKARWVALAVVALPRLMQMVMLAAVVESLVEARLT